MNRTPLIDYEVNKKKPHAKKPHVKIKIVLKSIEGYRAKNNHMGNYTTKLSKLCNMYLPLRLSTSNEPSRAKEDARKDQLSHFILRMAFCQSEELRRWFLTHESLLFR